jgi:hypothetical protein
MARPYDEDLDSIVFGTMRSPGLVTLSGHDRDKKWDVKPAKGHTGASMTLNGDDPGSFTATFALADDSNPRYIDLDTPSVFDRWDEFQKLIESTTNGPKPFALPIYHPDLARNRFTEVINAGVGGMVPDGKGGKTVTVKFKEYKPAKKKKSGSPTAKASGPRVGVTTVSKPDPNAEAKAELAGLLEQARRPS